MSYLMTTTLNRIWACNPCDEGRWRALRAAGKNAPDDEQITYQQIVEAVGLDDALWCCQAEPQYDREWRLFAVWCARQVQHLMSDQRSIDALDVAERYAHGEATDEQLDAARAAARDAAWDAWDAAEPAPWAAAWAVTRATARAPWATARDTARAPLDAAAAQALLGETVAATGDAQRDAFIQLVTTGELPEIVRQEVQ